MGQFSSQLLQSTLRDCGVTEGCCRMHVRAEIQWCGCCYTAVRRGRLSRAIQVTHTHHTYTGTHGPAHTRRTHAHVRMHTSAQPRAVTRPKHTHGCSELPIQAQPRATKRKRHSQLYSTLQHPNDLP
eukprot:308617-Rhodomonas_salina.1